MSRKGKIITWVIVLALLAAVVAVIVTNVMKGGAKEIDRTAFRQYVENTQYYKDGKPNEEVIKKIVAVEDETDELTGYVIKEDKIYTVAGGVETLVEDEKYYKDGKPNEVVVSRKILSTIDGGELEGYTVNTKGVIVAVGEDGKEGGELIVIWRVATKDYEYTGYTKNAKGDYVKSYYCFGPSSYNVESWDSETLKGWEDLGVVIKHANPNAGSWWSTVLYVVMIAGVCVVFFLIIRSSMGGAGKVMSFAKTKARISTNIKVRFADVAGAEEEKVELAEVVEFLRQPKKFSDLGARIPKGVLLVGPPGTGKTLFAKAVAGEAGVPFFSVSGSDFVEMYVGVGASRVRDLFEMAKKNQPCIIFVDEIDAVGRHRGAGLGGGNDEREQTLNQILVQMDGFESNEGVIVMAATNRADILDPALTRPGRFDRQVFVNLPDVKGREQILKVHARNKPLAPDINLKNIARLSAGFSGADLANLLNEAAILAARADHNFITNADLFEAFDKVAMGPAKKSKVVTEQEKRITAFHESGHAMLAKLCENCDPVHEVTIIPRGQAGGYTMMRPENDRAYYSKNFMLDDICMSLGGRVAEELVIKDISSGASGDIKAATKYAHLMVTELGMSDKLGLVSYSDDSQPVFIGKDMATRSAYSDETAKMIDDEIRDIIQTQHERARKLLSENRSILDNMARVLIEKETIYMEEVDLLMQGKTYSEVIEYMDKADETKEANPFKRYES